MPLIKFTHPFPIKDDGRVTIYFRFSNGTGLITGGLIRSFYGYMLYKYLVDDVETYCNNSLKIILDNGDIYNYVLFNKNCELDFNCAKQGVKIKDLNIMFLLANSYPVNSQKYIETHHLAAINGCFASINILIDYYSHNQTIPEFKYKQYEYLEIRAKLGDSDAAINLAKYYRDVTHNYTEMKRLLKFTSEKGCIKSMFYLGAYYANIKKYKKMKKYYKQILMHPNDSQEYIQTASNIGYYYQYIKINYNKMMHYYLIAIAFEHIGTMKSLANYYNDIGCYSVAKEYHKRIIKIRKNNESYAFIAKYYSHVEKNTTEAINYYLLAAEHGCDSSAFWLGNHYRINKKYKEMELWLLPLTNKNHLLAAYVLGYYYQFVEIDETKMMKYYDIVIKGDNNQIYGDTMYNLALFDNNIEHLQKSANRGHILSMKKLGDHYKDANYLDEAEKYYNMISIDEIERDINIIVAKEAYNAVLTNTA